MLFRDLFRTDMVRVPPHWSAEVSNILWKAHRRGRIDRVELGQIGTLATAIAGTVTISYPAAIDRLTEFAAATQLTAYDAAYLMLAIDLKAPLLALDGKLSRAAVQHQVEVVR